MLLYLDKVKKPSVNSRNNNATLGLGADASLLDMLQLII